MSGVMSEDNMKFFLEKAKAAGALDPSHLFNPDETRVGVQLLDGKKPLHVIPQKKEKEEKEFIPSKDAK